MTTDTGAQDRAGDRAAGSPSAAWPRAPACWRRAWPRCWCVLTTDAVADSAALDAALRAATRATFDRIDSDGCMSTNDTVLLLASGASGRRARTRRVAERRGRPRSARDLAGQLIADAEGATKEIAIEVVSAASEDDARRGGPLRRPQQPAQVRAASARTPTGAGCWPPVGTDRRGTSSRTGGRGHQRRLGLPRAVRPARTGTCVDLAGAGRARSPSTCTPGRESATIWTNDLTAAYVHENSAYST